MRRALLAVTALVMLAAAPALAGELTGPQPFPFGAPLPRELGAGDVQVMIVAHDGQQVRLVGGVTVLQQHASGITDGVCGPSVEAPIG